MPPQYGTQQIPGAGIRQLAKQGQWQREIRPASAKIQRREIVEQGFCFAETPRRSGKLFPDPGKAGRYGRNDLAPKEIPRVAEIGIAFVLNPLQLMVLGILHKDIASKPEQGTQHASPRFGHCGGPAYSGTAQKVMQNGFGLIVRMMRQENPIGRVVRKGLVAKPARCRFDPFTSPCGNLYSKDGYRDTKLLADIFARIGPIIGVTADTVMNMKCRKPQACVTNQTACRVQQHRGIQSAGKADGDSLARSDMAGKAGGYRLHDNFSEWFVP